MNRYFQLSEFDSWRIRNDEQPNNPWEFAREHKAIRVSVLCPSIDLDLARPNDTVKYSGPLFFDIDDSDLDLALNSAIQLCAKLKALDVDEQDIEIHLSGKKGVHIYIDSRVFSDGEPQENLAEIHAKMAMHLWVDGVDFQVYSEAKGRLVRPINAKRPDGLYKVPVTLEELKSANKHTYIDFVKSPRDLVVDRPRKRAAKLTKLYESCKVSLTKKNRAEIAIPSSVLVRLQGLTPDCVQMLMQGRRKRVHGDTSASFNNMAMQIGCWSKVAAMDSGMLDSIHNQIAKNNPSHKGETESSRVRKLKAMHNYLLKQDKYQMSCAALKKVVDGRPNCASCPVYNAPEMQNTSIEALYLTERHGHYYSDRDATQLVAPFTMRRECLVIDEDTRRIKSTVMVVNVPMTGQSYRVDDWQEVAWNSKLAFKAELAGIDGIGFFGTDNDVNRLKMTLTRDDTFSGAEVKQVISTSRIGLQYRKRSGPDNPRNPSHVGRMTYVEPKFSINDVGVTGTHIMANSVRGAPKLGLLDYHAKISPKADETFGWMLQMNSPRLLSGIVGWFLATHLKEHFFVLERKFPILCLSGVSGAGKNETISVMMRLCGIEGESAKFTLEVPNASKLPFQLDLSNSTTIPRVINEFNSKSVNGGSNHKAQYLMVEEMLKAAFDSQSIEKGRLGGGNRQGANVSTVSWQITAPVVALSEEPNTTPAILQRSIMLNMYPAETLACQSLFEAHVKDNADDLVDVGRWLVFRALETSIKDISTLFDNTRLPPCVSQSIIPPRVQFGYRVILTAYDWAINALRGSGMSEINLEALACMKEHFLSYISQDMSEIIQTSTVTEVDKVIKDFAIMAQVAMQPNYAPSWAIYRATHYAVEGTNLLIDIMMVYPLYLQYKRSIDQAVSISSDEAFLKTVKAMDYYVTDKASTSLLDTNGRFVLSLDIQKMLTKGLAAQVFM